MNNESFLGLLAESPFAGLQEHMSKGDDAVSKLGDFITAVTEDDWRTAAECAHKSAQDTLTMSFAQVDAIENSRP